MCFPGEIATGVWQSNSRNLYLRDYLERGIGAVVAQMCKRLEGSQLDMAGLRSSPSYRSMQHQLKVKPSQVKDTGFVSVSRFN